MIPKSALEALKRILKLIDEHKKYTDNGVAAASQVNLGAVVLQSESALRSLLEPTEARAEVPEVTHYQGSRVKCTPHMFPIIDLESHSDDGFDYYLVRSEVKSASPLPKAETQPVAWRAWSKPVPGRKWPSDQWVYWDEEPTTIQDDPEFSQFQALYAHPAPEAATIDVEAAAREIVVALNMEGISFEGLSAWAGALYEQNIAAIIRKHSSEREQGWVRVPKGLVELCDDLTARVWVHDAAREGLKKYLAQIAAAPDSAGDPK